MKFSVGDMVKISSKKVGPYDSFANYRGIITQIIKRTYTVHWLNTDVAYDGYAKDELEKVS